MKVWYVLKLHLLLSYKKVSLRIIKSTRAVEFDKRKILMQLQKNNFGLELETMKQFHSETYYT